MHIFRGERMKTPQGCRGRQASETVEEEVALGRQLCANGAPVPAMNHDSIVPSPDLRVQIIGPEETKAYNSRTQIGFALAARITNDSYRRLRVRGFKLTVPWTMADPIWPRNPRATVT